MMKTGSCQKKICGLFLMCLAICCLPSKIQHRWFWNSLVFLVSTCHESGYVFESRNVSHSTKYTGPVLVEQSQKERKLKRRLSGMSLSLKLYFRAPQTPAFDKNLFGREDVILNMNYGGHAIIKIVFRLYMRIRIRTTVKQTCAEQKCKKYI